MSATQKNTGIGAGVGAVAGAAIGSLTGGNRGAIATGAAIGAVAGGAGGYFWSQRMETQKKQMEQATQGTGIAVSQTANNELKLQIPSDASFDVGRSNIKPNFASVLDQFAGGLRSNPNADVRIIGHTDSDTGTDAINDPLSVDARRQPRATTLIARKGVKPTAIKIDEPRRARTHRRQRQRCRPRAEPPRGNLRRRTRAGLVQGRPQPQNRRHAQEPGTGASIRAPFARNAARNLATHRAAGVAPGRGWAATRSEPTWGRATFTLRAGGWPVPRLT